MQVEQCEFVDRDFLTGKKYKGKSIRNLELKGMSIEYRFNSIVLQYDEIQDRFPELIPMINSYLTVQKLPKKRKPRKKKKTVGVLIDKILDSLE